jgi:peptidoglycan hydrolase-like protein with peptidoglycan-binding domain
MFRRYTLLAVGALMLGSLPTLAAQQASPPPAKAAQQQQKPAARPAAHTWTMTQIKDVQTALAGLKLYNGEATGRMNAETRQAIRTFQKSHNLPVTGRLSDTLVVLLKAPAPAQ